MRKETPWLITIGSLSLLSTTAFSKRVRDNVKKEQDNRCARSGRREKLEVHHKVPKYRGGRNTENNAIALSRPEHAFAHRTLTETATSPKHRRANAWAEKAIYKRMTRKEKKEYKALLKARGRGRNR